VARPDAEAGSAGARARSFTAGLAYFGAVFAVGFALGVARTLWLAPHVGERSAELLETPVMVGVSYLAAGAIVRRFRLKGAAGPAMAAGLLALALLLAAELGAVLRLRGSTLSEYVASRDPVSGSVYVLSLLLFAVMPVLRARW
jgi:hypothetical protein